MSGPITAINVRVHGVTPNANQAIHDAAECSLLGVVPWRAESGSSLDDWLLWSTVSPWWHPD